MDYLSEKLEQLLVNHGCHHYTIIRICKCNEKTGSPDKIKRCGWPRKVDVQGERYGFAFLLNLLCLQSFPLVQNVEIASASFSSFPPKLKHIKDGQMG